MIKNKLLIGPKIPSVNSGSKEKFLFPIESPLIKVLPSLKKKKE
tara:strand:+ start:5387 stop:5518 length:132 start_codon:yes stop_codon:yes gene_type:complete